MLHADEGASGEIATPWRADHAQFRPNKTRVRAPLCACVCACARGQLKNNIVGFI